MTHKTNLVLRVAALSDPGTCRELNEDAVYLGERLLAVADGMGGHVHGDVASATAVAALGEAEEWLSGLGWPADSAARCVALVCRRLAEAAQRDAELDGMGTTLTALLLDGSGFTVAHIGDSRGYVLRGGEFRQFTTDHTFVQSLVDEGRLGPAEALRHPRRSMLMRALLTDASAEADVFRCAAAPGDRFLLCSDGLTGALPDERIADVLGRVADPDAAVRELVALANAAGATDNVSCVLADVTTRRRWFTPLTSRR